MSFEGPDRWLPNTDFRTMQQKKGKKNSKHLLLHEVLWHCSEKMCTEIWNKECGCASEAPNLVVIANLALYVQYVSGLLQLLDGLSVCGLQLSYVT